MKKWQVEQILYLNDFGKRKLALPSQQHLLVQGKTDGKTKRDNLALISLRRFYSFFLKVL